MWVKHVGAVGECGCVKCVCAVVGCGSSGRVKYVRGIEVCI